MIDNTQEAGRLADEIAGRLCEWDADGEPPVPLMQEAARYIRTRPAAMPDVVEAVAAIDRAEQVTGRGGDEMLSLTPHGWEYVYAAFDKARAALSPTDAQDGDLPDAMIEAEKAIRGLAGSAGISHVQFKAVSVAGGVCKAGYTFTIPTTGDQT